MNNETREYISLVADKVREVYKIATPIESMSLVVKQIGGEIKETDEPRDFDGIIRKSNNNSFLIEISKNQSEQRKNFTIAHELGHLFLHMGYGTDEDVWKNQKEEVAFQRFGTSEQEYQANEFAADLLMPREEYADKIYACVENGKVEIKKLEEIASAFNVSLSAVINRGRFLGILE